MILESAQMLCTTLNKRGFKTPYKSMHSNHPCVLWLDKSYDNFIWLTQLALELNREYRFRYGKSNDQASVKVIDEIMEHRYPSLGMKEFVQAMPDKYKYKNNPVQAYRAFYNGEKLHFATWTKRESPAWVKNPSFN